MSSPSSLNRARHLIITFACCPLFLDYLYFPLLISYLLFLHLLSLFSSSFFLSYPFFSFLFFIPSHSRFFWFLLISLLFFLHRQVSTDYGWRWKLGHWYYIWNKTEIQKWSCGNICSIWIHRIFGTWVRSKCIWYVLHKFVYLRWVYVPTFSLHRNFYMSGISWKNDFQSVKNIMRTFLLTL